MIFTARLEQMTYERSLGIRDERRHGPAIKEVKTGWHISASGKHFRTVQERKCPSRTSFFIQDDLLGSLSLAWVLAIWMADQRAFEHGIVVAVYRHANRLAIFQCRFRSTNIFAVFFVICLGRTRSEPVVSASR